MVSFQHGFACWYNYYPVDGHVKIVLSSKLFFAMSPKKSLSTLFGFIRRIQNAICNTKKQYTKDLALLCMSTLGRLFIGNVNL